MAALALASLLLALGSAQAAPGPEDLWVPDASPLRMISDPCDPGMQAEEGVSLQWLRLVMVERGHSPETLCGDYVVAPDAVIAAIEADIRDLSAQVVARSVILTDNASRPLDDGGSWGPRSEAAARALYLHFKADDYRALQAFDLNAASPAPPTQ